MNYTQPADFCIPPDNDCSDYIDHLIEDGDDLLDRKPRDICAVLSNAPPEFDDTIADLLRCLWLEPKLQNARLRKLADWLRDEPEMVDIASEVMADMAEESRQDEADCRSDY